MDAGEQPPPGVRATFLCGDCVAVLRRCLDRLPISVFGLHVDGYFAWLRPLSRKSSWPSGCGQSPTSLCSMSPLGALTWAPKPPSTGSYVTPHSGAWRSSSTRRTRRSSPSCATGYWSWTVVARSQNSKVPSAKDCPAGVTQARGGYRNVQNGVSAVWLGGELNGRAAAPLCRPSAGRAAPLHTWCPFSFLPSVSPPPTGD
jgi:hypothetical protein